MTHGLKLKFNKNCKRYLKASLGTELAESVAEAANLKLAVEAAQNELLEVKVKLAEQVAVKL